MKAIKMMWANKFLKVGLVIAVMAITGIPATLPAADLGTLPATDRTFLNVKLPAGEEAFLMWPNYPPARFWRFQHKNDVELHTTSRGVGPDSAMVVFTEKGQQPGEVLAYDIGAHGDKLKNFKGLCFWMRGDGGDGNLSIGCNWTQTLPTYPRLGKFPLAQKEWKKFFVPWEKFTPAINSNGFYFLNLKVEPATPRAAWAVVARIDFYQTETTEAIQPPVAADSPGLIPAANFVQPSVAAAAQLIPKTLAKLKAHQPVTIVAAGDSITAGAQLWYRNRDNQHRRDSDADIYFSVLEQRLAQYYNYTNHRAILKMWETVDKKTGKTASGAAQDGFAVMSDGPALTGTLPFDGLQVIGVGAGGKNTQFGFEHLADATMYKPDLVIWFYGVNDTLNNIKGYLNYSPQAIKALQQQGIEVILARPLFFVDEPYYSNSANLLEAVTALANENKVPWVDQFGAFNARGRRYVGDLLSDVVHPNDYGHQLLGSTLAAALGVPNQLIWEQAYFRALAAGAKAP